MKDFKDEVWLGTMAQQLASVDLGASGMNGSLSSRLIAGFKMMYADEEREVGCGCIYLAGRHSDNQEYLLSQCPTYDIYLKECSILEVKPVSEAKFKEA